jgi:Chitobiase/beta-hexosaminidase C-terminal domain
VTTYFLPFPAEIPTPSAIDPICTPETGYSSTDVLGVTKATDKWHGALSLVGPSAYIFNVTTGNKCTVKNGHAKWIGSAIGINHWAAGQCIVAIDDGNTAIAVRSDPDSNTCYYLSLQWTQYQTYPINSYIALIKRVNEVETVLWDEYGTLDNSNEFGYPLSDGIFLLLQVYGTDTVNLRAGIFCCKKSTGDMFADMYTLVPSEVPVSTGVTNNGGPAGKILCTVQDVSSNRIVAGLPGMVFSGPGTGGDANSMFNFNAGEIIVPDTTPPTTTASPAQGTYSGTQSVTLSANEAATIYWNSGDGTQADPTTASDIYSTPIVVDHSQAIKYFAKDTALNQEVVQTAEYVIQLIVDMPVSLGIASSVSVEPTYPVLATIGLSNGVGSSNNIQPDYVVLAPLQTSEMLGTSLIIDPTYIVIAEISTANGMGESLFTEPIYLVNAPVIISLCTGSSINIEPVYQQVSAGRIRDGNGNKIHAYIWSNNQFTEVYP